MCWNKSSPNPSPIAAREGKASKSIFAAQPSTTRATPTHLSVDPKGERLAYTSGKSVFLRSIDDPSVSTQYTGHTTNATVARFAPSGYYVASGDAAGNVRVWDCVGQDMITKGEFPIISGPIKDIAWDGESQRIIAVGDGKERFGHCISFDTGNSVGVISGHSSAINSVSIRQSRPYRAATASDDQTLVFFHGAPFKFNAAITGRHVNFVHGVAFSPNGEYFVSVGADRKIFLYDGKTGEFKTEIKDPESAHKGSILSVSWSKDSKRFVTASTDQTVRVWDVESKKNTRTWKFGPEGGAPSVSDHQVGVVWTPRDDNIIISLSLSGDLNYLDENSETPIRVVSGHQKAITTLTVTEEKTLFTGSYEGRICRWDIEKGKAELVEGKGHGNSVVGFVETPTGEFASVGWDDKIRRIDKGAGIFLEGPTPTEAQPKGLAPLGTDGILLLTTISSIQILSSTRSKLASLVPKFTPAASSASPKNVFAVAGQDNLIRIYSFTVSPPTITEINTLSSNRSHIWVLAYSPNGQYLAAGESSGKIVLYDAEDGYKVKTTRWAFHTGRVDCIAWNKEGTHVVTGGLDTNVFIYNVENPGKNLVMKNAHMGGVHTVAWEDKDAIVTAGADGAIKRWTVKW
ncbi:WD40 repeat-like protein [Rhizina undulata]